MYFEDYANQPIMPRMKTLADRVRFKMKELGIKQPRLAKLCGVSQPTINRLLHSETESPLYIYELSRALETSVRWLKTGVEDVQEVKAAVGHDVRLSMAAASPMTEAGRLLEAIGNASVEVQQMIQAALCRGEIAEKDRKKK